MQGKIQWQQTRAGAARGPDGRLWFATGLGLAIVDPHNLPKSRRPVLPRIEQVVADGRALSPNPPLELPSGVSNLTVHWAHRQPEVGHQAAVPVPARGVRAELGGRRRAAIGFVRTSSVGSVSIPGQHHQRRDLDRRRLLGVRGRAAVLLFPLVSGARRADDSGAGRRSRVATGQHDAPAVFIGVLRNVRWSAGKSTTHSCRVSRPSAWNWRRSPADSIPRRARASSRSGGCGTRRRTRLAKLAIWPSRSVRAGCRACRASRKHCAHCPEHITTTRGVDVQFTSSGRGETRCSGDVELQLLRICQEAVNNAIRHGHASVITITLDFKASAVVLRVSDNGCGFTPDGEPAASDGEDHLGLLGMRERAARVSGQLTLTSAPGAGTVIEIIVPVSRQVIAMVAPKIQVLCVDDHRLVRRGIISLIDLEPDMSVVAEASDGEEAVEQFKRHRPGVTLMDLELPRMNGVAAIRAIRHEQPDARIIVLTMYQGDEDIYRAVQAGAAAYLLKDAVPEVLIGVIRAGPRRRPGVPTRDPVGDEAAGQRAGPDGARTSGPGTARGGEANQGDCHATTHQWRDGGCSRQEHLLQAEGARPNRDRGGGAAPWHHSHRHQSAERLDKTFNTEHAEPAEEFLILALRSPRPLRLALSGFRSFAGIRD